MSAAGRCWKPRRIDVPIDGPKAASLHRKVQVSGEKERIPIFRTGYILNRVADSIWFVFLPFLAVGAGLGSQYWLTNVAVASCGLWLTLPHHFATWLRTYALSDEWRYYKPRLIAGPLVIAGMTLLGMKFAPLTLLLLIAMWDHQHSLMQQHGFARIYDFKAGTGAPNTAQYDLALNWILYINLFITTPLFATYWVRELYNYRIPISLAAVESIQTVSYVATGVFLCGYLVHVVGSLRQGYKVNPLKYLFLGASYFLWYYTCWSTFDILIYGVAHKIMHGVQYIVITHWYLWNKAERSGGQLARNFVGMLLRPGNVAVFAVMAFFYALIFQLIARQPLDEFGFGVVNITSVYEAPIREFGMGAMTREASYSIFAGLMIYSTQLLHYYFDSFIWKVRDKKVQDAL